MMEVTDQNCTTPKLMVDKSVDKIYTVAGDFVNYKITVTQVCEGEVSEVIVSDMLTQELEFIRGSVRIDGVLSRESNILAGVDIGELVYKKPKVITFVAKILTAEVSPIINVAYAQLSYISTDRKNQKLEMMSNACEVYVSNPQMKIVKKVNPKFVVIGDEVSCEVELTNTGDVDAYNVHFRDYLPNQLVAVPGKFRINNRIINGVEIEKGIRLGNIPVGERVHICYEALTEEASSNGLEIRVPEVTFNYRLLDGSNGVKEVLGKIEKENGPAVDMGIMTFKQVNIETYVGIPEDKVSLDALNVVTAEATILNYHIIQTPKVTSTEGQNLTGLNLVVRGQLNVMAEYTGIDREQSIHSVQYSMPFSSFVILPPNYNVGTPIDVIGVVENIYYKVIDIRSFYTDVSVLINVKIIGY
ncbi:MAG: SPOCS domain-containing protein [Cellulosilyticaceae bacterium]